MAKTPRPKKQVRAEKAALRKLRDSGLYSGKVDLRRAATPYQKSLMKKFADVFNGSAAVVAPSDPQSYKRQFKIVGDKVIVPKRKGERISVSKTGKIERSRKIGNRRTKSTIVKIVPERGAPKPKADTAIVFRVPFKRGTQKHGEVIDWRRFSYDGLLRFFSEYLRDLSQFDDWAQYIEVEELPEDYERDLDRYISGEVTHDPLPPRTKKLRRRHRDELDRMRSNLSDELGDE